MTRRHSPARSAFTLIEMLVVIAILALLTLLFLPNAAKSKSDAEVNLMMAKANQLNMAKSAYAQAVGRAAADANMAAQSDDNGRYTLLTPYLAYAPPTLSSFIVNGYSVTLGSSTGTPVTIMYSSNSTVIPYQ
jgi:prepilin-type N-terminal cleavage/methylation domain-containing protein